MFLGLSVSVGASVSVGVSVSVGTGVSVGAEVSVGGAVCDGVFKEVLEQSATVCLWEVLELHLV